MPTLKGFFDGLLDTIRMDDPKKPQRRKPACRECEIVACGACLTAAVYMTYWTRMGKIMPGPGYTLSVVFACLGAAMIPSFPPDEAITKIGSTGMDDPSNPGGSK